MELLFVLIPLTAYIPMFTFETYIAFRRIGKPLDKGGEYLHATWEVTHTLLILSINYFVWLYSPAITAVAEVAFVSMLLFGAVFIIRAIIYTYLFYIKSSNKPNVLADWLFAVTHVIMAGCLIYTVLVTLIVMQTGSYEPNNTYLPLLWPGLILMVPLISLPLYFLYRTKQ